MQLTAIAAAVALLTALGWGIDHARQNAALADLKAQHAEAAAQAEAAARSRLQAAMTRGDVLFKRLASAEATRKTTEEETQREIKRLSTGRACLGGAAVRLLNGAAGLRPGLPEAARRPAATDAAFATDADVGQWAAAARGQYEQCRGRLDALIAWHEAPDGESNEQ